VSGYSTDDLDLLVADLKAKTGVSVTRDDMKIIAQTIGPHYVEWLRRQDDE
jgi:hypothetical protein